MSAFDTASRLVAALAAVAGCAEAPAPSRPLSMLALRFDATVPQHFDYTCGASSVATVLTYYWDRPTTEAEAVAALGQRYSLEEIARRRDTGLSFDDLIFVAGRLGFAAQGAAVPLEQLPKLAGPVVVQLSNPTFQHFVVLRRVGDGAFYVSDPIAGNYAMAAGQFREQFTGYALAIWRPGAALPEASSLSRPHDGVSVSNSLQRVINSPPLAPHPIL